MPLGMELKIYLRNFEGGQLNGLKNLDYWDKCKCHTANILVGIIWTTASERYNIAITINIFQQLQTIFILYALVKKSQKTLLNSIIIAKNRLKEVLENK